MSSLREHMTDFFSAYNSLVSRVKILGVEAQMSLSGIGPSDLQEQELSLHLESAFEACHRLVEAYDNLTVWCPFISSDPLPESCLLLVTNNLNAKTDSGSMANIWLVRGVFRLPSGEVQAVAEGIRLRKLTHYRKLFV